ncbi:hypothetical protein CUC53_10420 [Aeromonas cavernicola]|uniref:Uncharacterized protein n=2 Tax=Aeromonas cavernicola TaxID=1006623 RepID=A0A2H9U468_9GAMM|nr:hypothetical protein CUC53_10420 [Aeromonas cavernicola]
MFFDWLGIEQTFDTPLPVLDGNAYIRVVVEQGEITEGGSLASPAFSHRGSFCDSVLIRASGHCLVMSGNPSRWGRVENLWGLRSIDLCVEKFNEILREIYADFDFIPQFTKCTRVFYEDGSAMKHIGADGAIIKELHVTKNFTVGAGNERKYLSAISRLPYRNSVPNLFTNGFGVDWKSKKGNASLIYPCIYAKANELELHSLDKIIKTFGPESDEVEHLKRVIDLCWAVGLVRYELKLKYRYLQRNGLTYWGMSDFAKLHLLMDEFTDLDKTLSVSNMTFETISQQLYSSGIVDSTRAANTTAMYAYQWMHGQEFDLNKSQTKTHRARLRKIGIDIARPCNVSQFSPIKMVSCTEIHRQEIMPPSWYQLPSTGLRLVG